MNTAATGLPRLRERGGGGHVSCADGSGGVMELQLAEAVSLVQRF
jgi:hypothetical protein